jgi:hypothetical protein
LGGVELTTLILLPQTTKSLLSGATIEASYLLVLLAPFCLELSLFNEFCCLLLLQPVLASLGQFTLPGTTVHCSKQFIGLPVLFAIGMVHTLM